MAGEGSLGIAFGALVIVCGVCIRIAVRASERRPAALATAVPFFGWAVYESLVGRVMPGANIRLDWFILLPLALVLLGTLAMRWRRLE